MPSLTILMLVKDEEGWLAPLLPRYVKGADEVIVGDAGSTDGTVRVAKAAGAKVVPIAWKQDFAAARNVLLARATTGWVLFLDADEVLSEQNLRAIASNLQKFKGAVGIPIRTYTGQVATPGFQPILKRKPEHLNFAGFVDRPQVRLWRNDLGLRYAGRILERLEPRPMQAQLIPLVIHHYREDASREGKRAEMAALLELIARKDSDAAIRFAWGLSLRQAGKIDKAIAAWKPLRADQPGLQAALGEAYLEAGRTGEAEAALSNALAQDRKDVPTLVNFGVLCLRKGAHKEAEAYVRRALSVDDRCIAAYSLLSLILLQEKKYAAVLANLEVAGRKTGSGIFQKQREELQKRMSAAQAMALESLEKAAAGKPDSPEAFVKLAASHAERGDEGRALAVLKEFVAAHPNHVPALANLAGMYHRFGRYEEEVGVLEYAKAQVAGRGALYVGLLVNLGRAYAAMGARAKAKEILHEALALKPRSPQPIKNFLVELG